MKNYLISIEQFYDLLYKSFWHITLLNAYDAYKSSQLISCGQAFFKSFLLFEYKFY